MLSRLTIPARPPPRLAARIRLPRQTTRGTAAVAYATSLDQAQHRPVSAPHRDEFWRSVPAYEHVSMQEFLSYAWNASMAAPNRKTKHTVQGKHKLLRFLESVLPDSVPLDRNGSAAQSKQAFIEDVFQGVDAATMAIRLTPYVLSRVNWQDPRHDPILRQFLPLKSNLLPDHPKLTLDSLHETADSPVSGLVHRYPDKALFLATSVCPTYCNFCTRSYAVGADTASVTKTPFKPTRRRWDAALAYIEATPQLQDIVVSGGDSYYLHPTHLQYLGDRLLQIPHIRRIRFASKGLAVAPGRLLCDEDGDGWAAALVQVAGRARELGKSVALHTHFNHPSEVSWVTEAAAQRLYASGVTVRNQTVLLKGVNDDVETMATLIRRLADNNIHPYYVYLCDMVKNNEHLRTPLQTILDLEAQLRGSIAGFLMPQFVVDLPGGGGKRLACSFTSYNRQSGISTYKAPAVTGGRSGGSKPELFEYFDPVTRG